MGACSGACVVRLRLHSFSLKIGGEVGVSVRGANLGFASRIAESFISFFC